MTDLVTQVVEWLREHEYPPDMEHVLVAAHALGCPKAPSTLTASVRMIWR